MTGFEDGWVLPLLLMLVKSVAMIVRIFMTLFNWFDTCERCASSRLVIRSWKNIDSSAIRTR